MDLKELINTLNYRRQGLAYELWKGAVITASMFDKNFPKTPEDASPELFPERKGIQMPEWLKEKALKQSHR